MIIAADNVAPPTCGVFFLWRIPGKNFIIRRYRKRSVYEISDHTLPHCNACSPLTHAHHDHIGALDALHQAFPEVPVHISGREVTEKYLSSHIPPWSMPLPRRKSILNLEPGTTNSNGSPAARPRSIAVYC
ncbi:MBL fold metallo-hydrolase [Paenibacillus mesophilus]|nr:MBL fold metallo-hydrolase [Paenibacillus mesophilus]